MLGPEKNVIWLKEIQYKSKAIPLQAGTDPECSRRSRLPYFKTVNT
jgi:hypothetical protein